MKYFLVIVLCMNGLCENFLTTEPEFTSREECRKFSETAVEKIRKQLPESSGSTYCFDEQEVVDITNRLLKEQNEFQEQHNQDI
jgi:hypothetical protein